MKNKYRFLSLGLILTFLLGCEDQLEQINPNKITKDSYYNNLAETEAVITTIYSTLLNHFVLNIEQETERADMGYPAWGRNAPTSLQETTFYYHTYTNSETAIQRKWEACYQGIWRANQAIEALERLEPRVNMDDPSTAEVFNRQMGEAHFFRGWYHFNLHQSFNDGNIIIKDKTPVSEADFNPSLSTSEEVLSFIREDLKFAYENLPKKYGANESGLRGRVTAGTAATILGNTHLFQGEYAEAIPYYEDVINNSEYGYELVRDMGLLFTVKGELNNESIFEINYNESQRTELGQWDESSQHNRLGRSSNNDQWFPSLWITYAYKTEAVDSKDPRNYYTNDDGDLLLRNVPLRCSAMVAVVEDAQTIWYTDGLSVSEKIKISANNGRVSYYKKYGSHDIAESEDDTPMKTGWRSGKNVVINRLSEVYLNYAECMIQTGNIPAALKAMNAIRARWGLQRLGIDDGSGPDFDGVSYTAQTLMDKLMYVDKPLELSAEGMSIRWNDMRRWGITKDRFVQLSKENYHMVNFAYTKTDGTSATSWRGSLQMGPDPGTELTLKDYEVAAENYNPDVHAYYPIPLAELQTNTSLK